MGVWTNLVSPNPQIFMVLCGHSFGSNGQGAINRVSTNAAGKLVYEELTDYQGVGGTGSGWMRLMEFDSELQQISFTTYSPLLDAYQTDTTNQFQVSFDWDERFGTRPEIGSVQCTDGYLEVAVVGDPGQVYLVQTSSNMTDWTDAVTVTNTTGSVEYGEVVGGVLQRFYRAKLVQ